MKVVRLLLPTFILLVAASSAFPDSDPKMVMGGGGSCQSFTETSFTQTFTGVDTECQVDFTNEISDGTVTLDLLVVNVDTPLTTGTTLSCAFGAGSPLTGAAFQSSPT